MDDTRRAWLQAAAIMGVGPLALPGSARAQGRRGGQVLVALPGRPRHFNPALQSGSPIMPGAQLFASPLTIGLDWKPRPYLAESWSLSDDNRSITLNLRKDAVFHDGRPITSADVEFSVQTVRDHHPFKGMFQPVNAVTTPDPHTAVVRLAEPHPALQLAMTTMFVPILPKHIYGDGQPIQTHPRNAANVVGSGPFRLVDFKPGEHVILERFDRFFLKDRPFVDRMVFREYKDTTSMVLAFERGDIDYLPFVNDRKDVARLRKVAGAKVLDNHVPGIGPLVWVAFNTKSPKLQDKRVRQAISYAIDREFILRELSTGAVKVATGPIHSASPFYSDQVERYRHDPQKAMALLDAAGLKPGADGKRLALTLDTVPSADQRTLAEYLRPALAKVGIDVTLRPSPDFPTWARRVGEWDFEMTTDAVFNWGDPVIGVHRTYQTSNIRKGVIWSNTQSYVNPKVDELLAQATVERDLEKRKRLYAEFQRIVVADAPVAFTHVWPQGFATRKTLVDVPASIWWPITPYDTIRRQR